MRELTRAGIDLSTIRWIHTETPLALGDFSVTLFPPQTTGEDNDRSIVIRAEGNGAAVLLTGDLDAHQRCNCLCPSFRTSLYSRQVTTERKTLRPTGFWIKPGQFSVYSRWDGPIRLDTPRPRRCAA